MRLGFEHLFVNVVETETANDVEKLFRNWNRNDSKKLKYHCILQT